MYRKIYVITLLLMALCGACSQPNPYEVEEQLLDCFYQQYEAEGAEIRPFIEELGQLLMKHKVLKSTSGKDIVAFIEQIKKDNDIATVSREYYTDFENLPKCIPALASADKLRAKGMSEEEITKLSRQLLLPNLSCQNASLLTIDTAKWQQSKSQHIAKVFEPHKGDIGPAIIAHNILQYFDEQDFNQEYYRTLAVLNISTMLKMMESYMNDLPVKLPPKIEGKPEERLILQLKLTAQNKLVVEDTLMDVNNLKTLVKAFITENTINEGNLAKAGYVIQLKTIRGVTYEFYVKVHDELKGAYHELRDERARVLFDQSYDQLNKDQQFKIRQLIPYMVSDSED